MSSLPFFVPSCHYHLQHLLINRLLSPVSSCQGSERVSELQGCLRLSASSLWPIFHSSPFKNLSYLTFYNHLSVSLLEFLPSPTSVHEFDISFFSPNFYVIIFNLISDTVDDEQYYLSVFLLAFSGINMHFVSFCDSVLMWCSYSTNTV